MQRVDHDYAIGGEQQPEVHRTQDLKGLPPHPHFESPQFRQVRQLSMLTTALALQAPQKPASAGMPLTDAVAAGATVADGSRPI